MLYTAIDTEIDLYECEIICDKNWKPLVFYHKLLSNLLYDLPYVEGEMGIVIIYLFLTTFISSACSYAPVL